MARVVLVAGLALVWVAGAARAQNIVTLFDAQSVLSPNNDTKSDNSRVRFSLNAPATVSLTVFEADSITQVRTLQPDTVVAAGGPHVYHWDGRRTNGTIVPDGAYVVTLRALGNANPDSVKSLPVFVDVTPPTIQILSVLPNPYAPGAPASTTHLNVSFTITDASPVSPGRVPDELRSEFATPAGAAFTPVALVTTPPYAGSDGSYVMAWDATQEANAPPDGEFRVTLTLNDVAGFTSNATYHFDVDTQVPAIKTTSLAENAIVGAVPDSLYGYAFDRRGVDSLYVRYAETSPFQLVSAIGAVDTLRFAVVLADSFPAEGAHQVDFRAVDAFGRAGEYTFPFSKDTTSPSAPVLQPFSGEWNSTRYPLVGYADGAGPSSWVRVYRGSTLVDSASTSLSDTFEVSVALNVGRNRLTAVARDGAFNVSPPSNVVDVVFNDDSGLFAPAPFTPGDAFDVSASARAAGCTLRIFDLTGDLVIRFEDGSAQQFYHFAWDGQNGSGQSVSKGPLVAVAAIDYPDGSKDVFREIFLYNPDAP